jgi:hypothetical protein
MPCPQLTFHFGKYEGVPLAAVPSGYLRWALAESPRLSRLLRHAVEAELGRRGSPVPPPPESRPVRACPACPGVRPALTWEVDRLGRKRVRADCPRCGRFCDYPPCVSPYTQEADANSNPGSPPTGVNERGES